MRSIFVLTTIKFGELTYPLKDKNKNLTGEMNTITVTKDSRPIGWYPTLGEAINAVEGNYGDMYEIGGYPQAVIEEIGPYIYPEVLSEHWFEWKGDDETGGYIVSVKPEDMKHVVGFGIG